MFKFFSTAPTAVFANDTEKAIVDSLVEIGQQRMLQAHKATEGEGKSVRNRMFAGMKESDDYMGDNEVAIKSLLAYCAEKAGISNDEQTLKALANQKNTVFSEKFFSVVSQALPVMITSTVNYMFMDVADVKNIGWGDTAHFKVASKDIFTVNKIGLGNKRGAVQRLYSEDITVNPIAREITIGLDWYQLVSGRYDFGDWMYRVGLSYATDITKSIYDQIDSAYGSLPAPLALGSFTDANWTNISQRVSLANGNMPVYALGTIAALGAVIPSNDYLKMELGQEFADVGYLGKYKGTGLLRVPQVLVPNTVNTTLQFGIDDNRIYFIALDADKPVKIVFEGSVLTNQEDSTQTADGQMIITVKNKYESRLASASVFGIIDIG